jgi:hypothetical protein
MKSIFILLPSALLVISACEAPPSSGYNPLRKSNRKTQERDTGSAGIYSMGGSSAANPPIKAGETSSAYRERMDRSNAIACRTPKFSIKTAPQMPLVAARKLASFSKAAA